MLVEKKNTRIYGNHIVIKYKFNQSDYEIIKKILINEINSQCDTEEVPKEKYQDYVDEMQHEYYGHYVDENPNLVIACECNVEVILFMYPTKAFICIEIGQFLDNLHGGFDLGYL